MKTLLLDPETRSSIDHNFEADSYDPKLLLKFGQLPIEGYIVKISSFKHDRYPLLYDTKKKLET